MPGILGDSPALATMLNIVRPVLPDLSEFEADFRTALRSGQVFQSAATSNDKLDNRIASADFLRLPLR